MKLVDVLLAIAIQCTAAAALAGTAHEAGLVLDGRRGAPATSGSRPPTAGSQRSPARTAAAASTCAATR